MSAKIGIPRALMYHYYYPMWKAFFNGLGLELKLSPKTNKRIVDRGVKIAVDDICLPFKVYYGHVLDLINKVEYLFVPRFVSLGNYNYVCPKFMGLPDILKANIKDLPELIEPVIDLRKGIMPLRAVAREIGRKFNKGFWEIEKAYWKAVKIQNKFEKLQIDGEKSVEAMKIVFDGEDLVKRGAQKEYYDLKSRDIICKKNNTENIKSEKILNIAVLGHSYIINDYYISMNIIKHLNDMGVGVKTVEMFDYNSQERAASLQDKKIFWYFNRKVMGTAYHLFSNDTDIDGIIQVTAFGCGPDSMVKELIDIRGKRNDISVLNINIDEHSGEAGLITRLEAFVDLLERRKLA